MDTELFLDMLKIDSTSGKEAGLADFLAERLLTPHCCVEKYDVGDGTVNLLFSWGKPEVVFCSHLDTVPPYIQPTIEGDIVKGRGSCDAKGQVFAMYEACKVLESKGYDGFGLLLLAGEETGSFGARTFREQHPGAEWVIVGEPTDNCMASASKGTKSFEVTFEGKTFHSGYPEYGMSAIEMFNDFMNALRSICFPYDDLLGNTTWNVGKLVSDNPQNILSDRLSCRVYFRTTFESDEMVCNVMKNIAGEDARLRFGRRRAQDGSDVVAKEAAQWQKNMKVRAFGGDTPTRYETLEGFPAKPVAFGSDAPQLTNFLTGCNVENASFSATNCAERTAFFKAVSEGKREFSAIAICGGKDGVIKGLFPPCGVCRQVMREFCEDDFEIHLLTQDGIETYTLGQLLPVSFTPKNIKKTEK